MKVKTNILKAFIEKVRMNEKQKIDEAVFNFDKEGLKINANSAPKQARVMGWLKTGAFTEYEEFGKVGMNELENVVKILKRFGEDILIKKEGNLLTISQKGKKVDIELVAEEFLSTDTGEPDLQFEDNFSISATALKEIFNDAQINDDAIITIETEEKKVKFSNTGKYKFLTELEAPTCKGGVKTKFGQPLIDAAVKLDGNLEIDVKTNYVAKIMEKTENSVITVIVAPRVEDDEK